MSAEMLLADSPVWASEVKITFNSRQKGIELYFNAAPARLLATKLRALDFRPSRIKDMWYAEDRETPRAFANELEGIIAIQPEGPVLELKPSFEPVASNIENKEFSYVLITLMDGQVKRYLVFEPSRPKAEVIARNFALENWEKQMNDVTVLPRTHIREARLLFEEGRIITTASK